MYSDGALKIEILFLEKSFNFRLSTDVEPRYNEVRPENVSFNVLSISISQCYCSQLVTVCVIFSL